MSPARKLAALVALTAATALSPIASACAQPPTVDGPTPTVKPTPGAATTTQQEKSAAATAPADPAQRPALIVTNAGWSRYSNPTVFTTAKATYFGTVTNTGSVQATRVDNKTAKISRTTLAYRFNKDDHAAPTFTRTRTGKIATFWSGHGTSPVYYKVSGSKDSMSFGATRRLRGSGLEHENATYTVVYQMDGEKNRYWLFTRLQSTRSWHLTTSSDLSNWTPNIRINDIPYDWRVDHTWPYMRSASSGYRTIDFVYTDSAPQDDVTNPSLYHFRYRAGRFEKSDGTLIATMSQVKAGRPINPREGTLLYDGSAGKRAGDGVARIYSLSRGKYGRLGLGMTTEFRPASGPDTYSHRWYGWSPFTRNWTQKVLFRNASVYPIGLESPYGQPNSIYAVKRETVDVSALLLYTRHKDGTWTSTELANGDKFRAPTSPQTVAPGDDEPYLGPISIAYQKGRWDSWKGDYDTAIIARTTGYKPRGLEARVSDTGATRLISGVVRQGVNGPRLGSQHGRVFVRRADGTTRTYQFTTASNGSFAVRVSTGDSWRVYGTPERGWGLFSTSTRRF